MTDDNVLSNGVRTLAAEKAAMVDFEWGCRHQPNEFLRGVAAPSRWASLRREDGDWADMLGLCPEYDTYVQECLRFGVTP